MNKRSHHLNNILPIIAAVCVIAVAAMIIMALQEEKVPRPSVNGALHVDGTFLVDDEGNHTVLRGLSTHGLTWYPQFVDEDIFRELSDKWNSNLIRLAMYSTEYCTGKKNESIALVTKGVDAAIATDMYVMIDWHVLREEDPNVYLDEAADFFDFMSRRYSGVPNVIYEICNEPNGSATWEDVKRYADYIIPVIRSNSPDAVIMVGTPDFSHDLDSVLDDPLDYENIMYSYHFYAGTHYGEDREKLDRVVSRGLPVYITECGITEVSNGGKEKGPDYENSKKWFTYMKKHDMGFTVWSLANKDEPPSMVKPIVTDFVPLDGRKLTDTGLWVRELVRGVEPELIPDPGKEDLTFQDRNMVSAMIYRVRQRFREVIN